MSYERETVLLTNVSIISAIICIPERAGADVVECACLIGLPKFKVHTHSYIVLPPLHKIWR
jgi:adenine phosphoribosyltransferase